MFPPLSPVSNIWIAMLQDLQGWEEHHSAGGPETTHEPAVQCASWGELLYIITCTYIFIQSYSRYVCRDCMHTHTPSRMHERVASGPSKKQCVCLCLCCPLYPECSGETLAAPRTAQRDCSVQSDSDSVANLRMPFSTPRLW